ncbi:nitroreductase family protein [Peptoniphilus catoniae]|uniref:nitroreductase family protein n=1 Tax=Peptoniphilus catoniae TaxID=1660341 RepID=UPI0010FD70AD|nr:nitroreductase family protein [Peptoniphilus catoniae]
MFSDLIKKRRSIRKFKDQPLKKEEIKTILEAGLRSPTAKNLKSVHFVVVEDKDTLEKLSHFKTKNAGFLKDAALAIAVLSDKRLAVTTYSQDATIAATILQLQAEDLDIGSCWANINIAVNDKGIPAGDAVREILDIPEYMNVECVLAFGYKNEKKSEKALRSFEDFVHYGKF